MALSSHGGDARCASSRRFELLLARGQWKARGAHPIGGGGWCWCTGCTHPTATMAWALAARWMLPRSGSAVDRV
eukprot:7379636-Prymnesium_polylepis.2